MPLYATVDGVALRAIRNGPRRARCVDCSAPMLARTGDVVVWHWAHLHQPRPDECSAAGEGEWHLLWKSHAADGTQERAVGNRRADVLAPGGFAVEFQASPLTAVEVSSRERDWKAKLVWVFDAREAYAEDRLLVYRHEGRSSTDAYRVLRWSHAPERIRAARCRSLLDMGGGRLVFIGKWYDKSPLRGYGWEVTQDWVVAYVLHGSQIPDPPGYKQEVNALFLAAKAKKKALAARPRGAAIYQAATMPRCSPRMWEPAWPTDGWPHWRKPCFDCGRVTARRDHDGNPRCLGPLPTEPRAIVIVRNMLGIEFLRDEAAPQSAMQEVG